MKPFNRRTFLKITGASIGVGALYVARPALGSDGEGRELLTQLGKANGEKFTPFSFVQLSDAHVGFSGPPNPLGTAAFERAVEVINGLEPRPDLVLFTGDLTHDTEVDLRGERDGARECHVPGSRDGIPGWSKEDPKEDHEHEGQTAWQWGVRGQRL